MQRRPWAQQALRFTLVLAVILNWAVPADTCSAADAQHVVTTRHTILTFNSVEDMAVFGDAIQFAESNSLASIFSSPSPGDTKKELVRKIDLLFEKVQLILDMRKPMNKVKIKVHSNQAQLQQSFRKIYKKDDNPRGWYLFDNNTVYINAEDVQEGMLAHELGHAIIDHYFSVRPPRATAEILAKYVDLHLFDEVKQY